MSSIQIQSVSKHFGDFRAVDDLSLDISEGEFVALLGPSGCGKTTTMNMIAGIERQSSGSILFNGHDLSDLRIQDRNVGFVFQNYAIFTHLSVYKNLAFGLEVRNTPRAEIDRRVTAMAERMGLAKDLSRISSSLSVNEMQKLAIGRSAVVEPRVFLLDEPLSNVDASFRAYMRAELKVLQHEFGQTMIYVTHDQIEAMSLADKIAVIQNGKLQQYGAPLDVYHQPANRFVANFVGSPRINLIDGDLVDDDGRMKMILSDGSELVLAGRLRSSFAGTPRKIRGSIGIRPQDIYYGDRRSADDISVRGRVQNLERIGPKRLAYLQAQQTQFLALDERDELREGSDIEFFITTEKALGFDFESGVRLEGRSQ